MSVIAAEAYKWGVKAAREGFRLRDNPYNVLENRDAWTDGFKSQNVRKVEPVV